MIDPSQIDPTLPVIKALLVMDNEGRRVAVNYYTPQLCVLRPSKAPQWARGPGADEGGRDPVPGGNEAADEPTVREVGWEGGAERGTGWARGGG